MFSSTGFCDIVFWHVEADSSADAYSELFFGTNIHVADIRSHIDSILVFDDMSATSKAQNILQANVQSDVMANRSSHRHTQLLNDITCPVHTVGRTAETSVFFGLYCFIVMHLLFQACFRDEQIFLLHGYVLHFLGDVFISFLNYLPLVQDIRRILSCTTRGVQMDEQTDRRTDLQEIDSTLICLTSTLWNMTSQDFTKLDWHTLCDTDN